MNKQEAIKELESHKMIGNDARSACYNEAIKAGIFVINQLDEPQKQVVPGFVAELLDYYRQSPDVDLLALLITFKDWYYSTAKDGDHEEAIDWLVKHPEIYMRAWLFGYEVEKEQLYYVYLPKIIVLSEMMIPDIEGAYLMKSDDEIELADNNDFDDMKFTEQEIKAIDERYWAFAVPVEEVAEG
ncbi:DUF1642 domain-containing protein [Enterococcus hirae]|uniref:DUF1642 domain-containing protein n=1 Tax=Enterococcus hirae TaxID=1354 RepID=UPI0015F29E82|nr:DUF1642 domain-containing protein [Enterococcus hirae]MBA5254929.1 DUF1642 domain-containing protein [Enterococcus hirae]